MLPEIKTILYSTDLGAGAPHVFRYALSIAQKHDARIAIVHAMEPLSTFGQSLVELHISHEQSEEIHRQAREKVKGDIEGRLETFCALELCGDPEGRERVSEIRIVEGQPAQEIVRLAGELKADLVVMGTHRHTAVGEALLGTTAHKVLHSCELPTLLVRIPNGYREEGF
ncbi:MAG: universal stress protein [Desulfuromonas sp.]|uniref:universal stress protein n=1 Tax=Desulfuromonas sp. TaxID=892 RepID=UPI000CC9CC98|nr:universal stress protein [Desulfuromonas sp.]PLX85441.1 MAG: universal stress protein [Desulfuromonas sp.]